MKPKFPCTKECDARKPGCHSALCPYGWLEYEERRKIHLQEVQSQYDLTDYQFDKVNRLTKRMKHLNVEQHR